MEVLYKFQTKAIFPSDSWHDVYNIRMFWEIHLRVEQAKIHILRIDNRFVDTDHVYRAPFRNGTLEISG
jgi:hypothetical protein